MSYSLFGKLEGARIDASTCIEANKQSPYYEDELRCVAICRRDEPQIAKIHDAYIGLARQIVVERGKGSVEDMKDVYQNAFIKLISAVDVRKFPPLYAKLSSWLYTVIENEWLQWLRKDKNRHRTEETYTALAPLRESLNLTEDEFTLALKIIDDEFNRVDNDKRRQLLRLHFFDNLPPDETAKRLGYKSGRVVSVKASQHFSLLRKNILKQFKEQGLIK